MIAGDLVVNISKGNIPIWNIPRVKWSKVDEPNAFMIGVITREDLMIFLEKDYDGFARVLTRYGVGWLGAGDLMKAERR